MHLAVDPDDLPLRADDRGAVVVQARGAPLEDGNDHRELLLPGGPSERLRGGSGNRLGQIESARILALAEVRRAEELGKAHDLSPFRGGFSNEVDGPIEILPGVGSRPHLHETDPEGGFRHARIMSRGCAGINP